MSTNPELRSESAQDIRLRRQMEREIDTDAGRAKIIETFAEIQEAEAKGETQPSWENDENQEEYNFIFRNGQEFNVIAPTLEFAKKQCQLFLEDPLTGIKVGDDWEVFDVEITDLEEVKDRYYKPPVITGGNSDFIILFLLLCVLLFQVYSHTICDFISILLVKSYSTHLTLHFFC